MSRSGWLTFVARLGTRLQRRQGLSRLIRRLTPETLKKLVIPRGSRWRMTVRDGPLSGAHLFLDPRLDAAIADGSAERDVQEILVRRLRPGSVFYDIGASFGYHTLLGARLVGDTGHVYAFEPHDAARDLLRLHLQANAVTCVTVVPQAVTDRIGAAGFVEPRDANMRGGRLASDASGADVTVATVGLDTFAARHRPPDVIKIDVEGSEVEVLRSAFALLSSAGPTIVVEAHSAALESDVMSLLTDHKYHLTPVEAQPSYPRHVLAERSRPPSPT